MAYNPLYFAISRPWGPVGQNVKRKKIAHFREETFAASIVLPLKGPERWEIVFFRFRPGPGISLSAQGRPRPKWPEPPVFRNFPPVGVRLAKTQNIKKTVLFILGPPLLWGPPEARRG